MGKYSGMLLLSDFDGTLYTGNDIPQRNIDAIKRFCSEGGRFGFSSGRNYTFFLEATDSMLRPNTYISTVNGTVIYDYARRKIVEEKFIKDGSFDKIIQICRDNTDFKNVAIFNCDKVSTVDISEENGFFDNVRELMKKPVHKAMFHSRKKIGDDEKEAIAAFLGEDYYVSRSWAEGIEVQSADSTKGAAALTIKELSGSDLLVCVGDYENDETMIKAADIGYAVGNATDDIKRIADRITVNDCDGAIAAIIDDLGSI